jgi:hypothetical protein
MVATRGSCLHIETKILLGNLSPRPTQPRTDKELFNYRHSSLRSTVERTFGILKNRFPILENMPPYEVPDQRLLVVACCTIHNFICKDCGDIDPLFRHALQQLYSEAWIDVSQ